MLREQWGDANGVLFYKVEHDKAFAQARAAATPSTIEAISLAAESDLITALLHDPTTMEVVVKCTDGSTLHASYTVETRKQLAALNKYQIRNHPSKRSPLGWNDDLAEILIPKVRAPLVKFVLSKLSGAAANRLAREGIGDRIRQAKNASVNAPIQGGVSDCILYAYALLNESLKAFPTVKPVQSVHDSIVLECNLEDAQEMKDLLKSTMEKALSFFIPDVPVKADVDIQTSLDGEDSVDSEEMDNLMALAEKANE